MSDVKLDPWFDAHGYHNGKALHYDEGWLVSQIFFYTDRSNLDERDKQILDMIGSVYGVGLLGAAQQKFAFVGYADIRGTGDYNYNLALSRVQSVKKYIDTRLGHYSSYKSEGKSRGSRFAGRTKLIPMMAGDRRVDVFAPYRTESSISVPVQSVIAKYTGKLSHKFKFKTIIGGGIGKVIVGAQVVSIEVMNSRTGKKAMYTYTGGGAGVGAPIQINRPTKFEEKEIKDLNGNDVWMDVDDFEGPGKMAGAGVGYQKAVWIFRGPKDRGISKEPVFVDASGMDIAAGVGVDFWGEWHKR